MNISLSEVVSSVAIWVNSIPNGALVSYNFQGYQTDKNITDKFTA